MPKHVLLRMPEAAEYLDITERHLRSLLQRRVIPFHKVGGLNMFAPEDLDAYLASTRVEAEAW